MQIEVVSTDSELDRLGPAWNQLVAASEMDKPFLQWEWCSTWWRHYGTGHELAVLLLRDKGELIGLAPMYVQRGNGAGHRGAMKFLGTGEVCSEYLGFILRRGREEEAAYAMLDSLMRESAVPWRQLNLTHMPATSPSAHFIEAYLRGDCRRFRLERALSSWSIELPSSWDDLLRKFSRNRRDKIRRMLRTMESSELEFHEITSEDEIDAAWADLKRLHQIRWACLGKPGCFASRRFSAFHGELLRPLRRRGMLLLSSLRHRGQAIAATYSLRHRGRIYCYQGGHDSNWLDCQPGHTLRVCEMRRAVERGDQIYDFLGGDEPYKQQWATHQQPLVGFTVAGPGLLAQVRFGLENAVHWVKQAVRSRLPADTWATLSRWKGGLAADFTMQKSAG